MTKRHPETVYIVWVWVSHGDRWSWLHVLCNKKDAEEIMKYKQDDLMAITEHKILPPPKPKGSQVIQEAE